MKTIEQIKKEHQQKIKQTLKKNKQKQKQQQKLEQQKPIIQKMNQWYQEQGYHKPTTKTYLKTIKQYTNDHGTQINENNLNEYFFTPLQKTDEPRRCYQAITAIKNLATATKQKTVFKKWRQNNKRRLTQKPRRNRVKVLPLNLLKRVVQEIESPANIMMMIQWDTGYRSKAVLELRVKDVQIKENNEFFLHAKEKGGKTVVRKITKPTSILLAKWIKQNKPVQQIFKQKYSWYRRRIREACQNLIEKGVPGMKMITSHWLRSGAAEDRYVKNKDFVDLVNFLGHSNPRTTMEYVKSWGHDVKEVKREPLHD